MTQTLTTALTDAQVEAFIRDGFVRLDAAFPRTLAEEARAILWRETGADPDDRGTWRRPVVRLGGHSEPPFVAAANTPRLRSAFDQLVGAGRWAPLGGLGTFPIRFPSTEPPGDDGWHVDASFPGENPADFFSYRINVRSRGRALLMLFLFSDVGEDDAPTRIRVSSHQDVARMLAPEGDEGLSFMELAGRLDVTAARPEALATGAAGDVYLCHPFLVHAAQAHRGREPKFMAQPPLHPRQQMELERADGGHSPVERAIRQALGLEAVRGSKPPESR